VPGPAAGRLGPATRPYPVEPVPHPALDRRRQCRGGGIPEVPALPAPAERGMGAVAAAAALGTAAYDGPQTQGRRRMMDAPASAAIVNCVRYARDGARSDISLDNISDVLAVDDGSFVWVGVY